MTPNKNMIRTALCLATALLVANVSHAQSAAATQAKPGATQGPDQLFTRWDKDKNKGLSLDEFRAGWQEVQSTMALRKLHDNFVTMDANKSGGIEAAEYSNLELIKKAGSAAPMMSAFDADKNNKLDFKEYVSLVSSLVKNKR